MFVKTLTYTFFIISLSSMGYANNDSSVGEASSMTSSGPSGPGASQTNDRATQTVPRRTTSPPIDSTQPGAAQRGVAPRTEGITVKPNVQSGKGAVSQDPVPPSYLNKRSKNESDRADGMNSKRNPRSSN